jgi:thioesterase domain-containing protein
MDVYNTTGNHMNMMKPPHFEALARKLAHYLMPLQRMVALHLFRPVQLADRC